MDNKRILVVDDSTLYQRLLSDVINARDGLEVVGVASNGRIALGKMAQLLPDLVTLDILMSEMDGIQTLIELRKSYPSVVTIMVSSLTSAGSEVALDALALGASEYSVKPSSSGGIDAFRAELENDLLPKIEALCGLETHVSPRKRSADVDALVSRPNRPLPVLQSTMAADIHKGIELIAIGVSTGGPEALATLLGKIPGEIGVPIVIVQHMPAAFTAKLAKRLDLDSALDVVEAQASEKLRPNTVYIAPGDYHMVLELVNDVVTVKLNSDEPENSCRPSVDPLFRSIPAIYGGHCLGVIMTGMGADGLNGCAALHAAGCPIIVQDEHSSVVWGMPKLVALAGLAQQQVPLDQMAEVISKIVDGSSRVKNRGAANAVVNKQTTMSGRRS